MTMPNTILKRNKKAWEIRKGGRSYGGPYDISEYDKGGQVNDRHGERSSNYINNRKFINNPKELKMWCYYY